MDANTARAVRIVKRCDWLTVAQVASMYGYSRVTIWRWVAKGLLPSKRSLTGGIRIARSEAARILS